MAGVLDNQSFDLPCPNCGRKTKKTVAWVKTNKQFVCACGTTVKLDADQFKRKVAHVETKLANLKKAIGRIGKK